MSGEVFEDASEGHADEISGVVSEEASGVVSEEVSEDVFEEVRKAASKEVASPLLLRRWR